MSLPYLRHGTTPKLIYNLKQWHCPELTQKYCRAVLLTDCTTTHHPEYLHYKTLLLTELAILEMNWYDLTVMVIYALSHLKKLNL
ncbi:hypothetical protein CRENPOLYSF2_440002 [Crenothrix polyspora]|uniref:Uncharacterized protein n=1 Tax=Crenothrix polyspora TaxID=360316 RepID=A0A1R4HFB3_9GAMM|nr:hypothetical protein CRENPOLYSF2_440002 [Crenothrix polyspora]